MNMYIHKDGKTNIMDRDGLLLNDFDNTVDVILTNPPLGDQSYTKTSYDKDFQTKRMEVIQKIDVTAEKIKSLRHKIVLQNEKIHIAKDNSPKKVKTYEQKLIEYEDELSKLESLKEHEYKVSGSQMKGGALFINASWHYLKTIRNKDLLPEWRGGKLLLILDEGILNTEDYTLVRTFIKQYFYIKAVISLTRDTFIPISHTSAVTI